MISVNKKLSLLPDEQLMKRIGLENRASGKAPQSGLGKELDLEGNI
jgi:hypothetical protein